MAERAAAAKAYVRRETEGDEWLEDEDDDEEEQEAMEE